MDRVRPAEALRCRHGPVGDPSAHGLRRTGRTARLRRQISFEDYTKIFETIWQDRARAAGWTLEIEYVNEGFPASTCVLRFKRPV